MAVIVERRTLDSPWLDDEWHACAVVIDPPSATDPATGDGAFSASEELALPPDLVLLPADPIELYAKEAEGCRVNLDSGRPVVWVILDTDVDGRGGAPVHIQLVTVSAYEAQEYLDAGDLVVDVLPMPRELRERLEAFVAAQPTPEPFRKRKNRKPDVERYRFGKEPLKTLRERMNGKVPR